MKSDYLHSIFKENCKFSKEKVLKSLKNCLECDKIPLPSYRPIDNQNLTFCKDCYFKKNFDSNKMIEPSQFEFEYLQKLIINCKFEEKGCLLKFDFGSLNKFFDHERSCTYNESKRRNFKENNICYEKSLKKCPRCNALYSKLNNHECVSSLLKTQEEMKIKIETLTLSYYQMVQENKKSNENLQVQISDLSYKFNLLLKKEIKNLKFNLDQRIRNEKRKTDLQVIKEKKDALEYHAKDLIKVKNSISNLQKDLNTGFNKKVSTMKGHKFGVNSLIQLNDGTIASCSEDNTIKIWDLKTNQDIKTLIGHSSTIFSLIKLFDGTIASSSQDKTIKIWDPKTNKCIKSLTDYSGIIYSLIQQNDESIISCSSDKTLKIWDLKSNKCIKSLNDHTGIVYSLIKINDESFASGSKDKTIRVWNWKTHKCVTVLTGHEDDVKALIV